MTFPWKKRSWEILADPVLPTYVIYVISVSLSSYTTEYGCAHDIFILRLETRLFADCSGDKHSLPPYGGWMGTVTAVFHFVTQSRVPDSQSLRVPDSQSLRYKSRKSHAWVLTCSAWFYSVSVDISFKEQHSLWCLTADLPLFSFWRKSKNGSAILESVQELQRLIIVRWSQLLMWQASADSGTTVG